MSIESVTGIHLSSGTPAITGHFHEGGKWVTVSDPGVRINFFWKDIDALRAVLSKIGFEAARVENELRQEAEAADVADEAHALTQEQDDRHGWPAA